jgi:hypothetical protein
MPITTDNVTDAALADFQRMLSDVLDECVNQGMTLPLVLTCVSQNHCVLVIRVNDGAEPDTLAEHYEGGMFVLPINIMIVSANNDAVRVTIEKTGERSYH